MEEAYRKGGGEVEKSGQGLTINKSRISFGKEV